MSALRDCLSELAIASWADRPDSIVTCQETIRVYIKDISEDKEAKIAALRELNMYFAEYSFDTSVAGEIKRQIISALDEITVSSSRNSSAVIK